MERLTTGLDDGSIEKLRELAGGERRVGRFLSQVVTWLWHQKEQLEKTPLSDYVLVRRDVWRRIEQSQAQLNTVTNDTERLRQELSEIQEHQRVYDGRLAELEKVLASYTEEELDAMEESARKEGLRQIVWLMEKLSDEQLNEYIGRPEGEWIGEVLRKLSSQEIAKMKAQARGRVTAGAAG